MQQFSQDEPGDEQPGRLPAIADARKAQSIAVARNQQLSLDLRASDAQTEADDIDLLSYWRVLIKRRWLVLGVLGIVLATALVGTLLTTPVYRATAIMQIERNTLQVVNIPGVDTMEDNSDDDFYQTQYELLKSRSIAQRVASELGLSEGAELDRLSPSSPWSKLWSLSAGNAKPQVGAGPAKSKVAMTDAAAAETSRSATALIQTGLTIQPVANSRLVRINFDSIDSKFAQRAANAVADTFIANNLERRLDSSSYAKGYLEDRLQEMKLKLEDSERKLVEVAHKEQIVGTDDQSGSLSQQNLSTLNTALAQARADRFRAESRWTQAQASRGLALMIDDKSNSIIKTLQESRAALMSDYQQKLSLYKPAYPLMLQLKGQINEVDKQIAAESANIRASVQAQYLAAVQQERLLTEQMSNVKGEALDLQSRSIQYTIYKREVDTNRQLYDSLLKQYKEIGISSGVSNNNISIVDRAEEGLKFKPSFSGNLSLGLFFGLLLGVVLALGIEYLDDTLKSPEDVEQHLGLPVLGVIPKLKEPMTPLRALEDPRCAFAESYRSLRTALQFSTNNGTPRCLLVTSASPKEGKSTSAIVLAQNFAQLGKSVLLIDCDLRNPSLHKQLGVANTNGLTNYLAGAAKPEEVISPTQTAGLMVIPSGPLPPNPAELLLGPKMISLLTVAVRKYDQVILDGPPIMGLADAPILANMASGTLMVVESGETITVKARDALKRVWSTRAHVVGVLLTKFEAHHASYGYGYGDYNYYTYGGKAPAKLTQS